MVFKKQLTPLSKNSRVVKHAGKGGVQQRLGGGERESVTGADPLQRAMGRYPAAPQPVEPTPAPAPSLGGPALGSAPTAMMPPDDAA
jgi:hypothetical protein